MESHAAGPRVYSRARKWRGGARCDSGRKSLRSDCGGSGAGAYLQAMETAQGRNQVPTTSWARGTGRDRDSGCGSAEGQNAGLSFSSDDPGPVTLQLKPTVDPTSLLMEATAPQWQQGLVTPAAQADTRLAGLPALTLPARESPGALALATTPPRPRPGAHSAFGKHLLKCRLLSEGPSDHSTINSTSA